MSPELQRWMYQRSGAKVTEVRPATPFSFRSPPRVAQVIEAAAKRRLTGNHSTDHLIRLRAHILLSTDSEVCAARGSPPTVGIDTAAERSMD